MFMARLITSVAVIVVLALTACGSKAHSGAASSEASKAKAPATVADTQLTKDGYTALHIPGFGKVDVGIKAGTPKYEAVYIYKGKDPATLKTLVVDAQKRLAGKQGVAVKQVGTNLVVFQANTARDLEAAVKAVVAQP